MANFDKVSGIILSSPNSLTISPEKREKASSVILMTSPSLLSPDLLLLILTSTLSPGIAPISFLPGIKISSPSLSVLAKPKVLLSLTILHGVSFAVSRLTKPNLFSSILPFSLSFSTHLVKSSKSKPLKFLHDFKSALKLIGFLPFLFISESILSFSDTLPVFFFVCFFFPILLFLSVSSLTIYSSHILLHSRHICFSCPLNT